MDKSLNKGLIVLETLVRTPALRGISDLARHLGMTKSNIHRVLQTLVAAGFVNHDPAQGRYVPSLKLWQLGALIVDQLDLREVASPILSELASATGETAYLSVLENGKDVVIARVEGRHIVREHGRVGFSASPACTGTGKAMLAHAPAVVVDEVAATLVRLTPKTITDRTVLDAALRGVRRVGYAVSSGEWSDTVCGIGAPVFGIGNALAGAIGLSGPIDRLSAQRVAELKQPLLDAAARLSAQLGASRS